MTNSSQESTGNANYAVATDCFSKACEMLTTAHHGGAQDHNHSIIIHAHLLYGKALLQNAISLASFCWRRKHVQSGFPGSHEGHQRQSAHPLLGRLGEEASDQVTVEDELENAFHVLDFARQTIVNSPLMNPARIHFDN
ncbi:hypothetical protein VP01_4g3 [Puccinia sorghi]|uniref:Uncharacterized protein n=1 Tax=Puccinia sorghi TaxID=27349 RepID=A0A0L6UNP3_9BASI|nr:hypothetical protein VP01_4g3 [Puccinia sorghi]